MKQTVITTIQCTDIVDMEEITPEMKRNLADAMRRILVVTHGTGGDDIQIKVQVFQHDGDDQ